MRAVGRFKLNAWPVAPGSNDPATLGRWPGSRSRVRRPDGRLVALAGANTDLARLYSAGHVVDSALTEAAFQIAVWEIAYETTGTYKVNDGDAFFTGSGADTVLALGLAKDWLENLGSGNGYAIRVLQSGFNQDEVFATRVPEPGTFALACAAFAAMVGVRRRRARSSSSLT